MRTLLIAGIALSLTVLGGCSRSEKARVNEGARDLGQQMRGAAENARQAAADAALAGKVKTALMTRKGLEGSQIDVEARNGVVTLKGDVATREQAEIAEQVAQATDGVTSVNNQLMLRIPAKPTPPAPARPAGSSRT
jgi:osmotically-inducible protein OsmY